MNLGQLDYSNYETYFAYTLSLHFYTREDPQNHLDLFLDIDQASPLLTYKGFLRERRYGLTSVCYEMHLSASHQRSYLKYEGNISMNRGRIKIIQRGRVIFPNNFDKKKPPVKFFLKFIKINYYFFKIIILI